MHRKSCTVHPFLQFILALAVCAVSACALPDPSPQWMQDAPKVDEENGICSDTKSMLPDYGGRGGGGRR